MWVFIENANLKTKMVYLNQRLHLRMDCIKRNVFTRAAVCENSVLKLDTDSNITECYQLKKLFSGNVTVEVILKILDSFEKKMCWSLTTNFDVESTFSFYFM